MLNLNNDQTIAYLWQELQRFFVKKEPGKGLSTEDFTAEEKRKLAGIAEGAQAYAPGDIFVTTRTGNPAELLGYGTWQQIKDKFLLAAGDSYAAGSTGGEAKHTLTEAELAGHEGHLSSNAENWGGSATTLYLNQDTMKVWGTDGRGWNRQAGTEIVPAGHTKGSSQPHNNMPPYLAVYMWLRTA